MCVAVDECGLSYVCGCACVRTLMTLASSAPGGLTPIISPQPPFSRTGAKSSSANCSLWPPVKRARIASAVTGYSHVAFVLAGSSGFFLSTMTTGPNVRAEGAMHGATATPRCAKGTGEKASERATTAKIGIPVTRRASGVGGRWRVGLADACERKACGSRVDRSHTSRAS